MKGENIRIYLLLALSVAVLAIVLIQFFQISEFKNQLASVGNTATGGAIDTSGWTANEKMNYEMHGIIPSRVKGASSAGVNMVGGC